MKDDPILYRKIMDEMNEQSKWVKKFDANMVPITKAVMVAYKYCVNADEKQKDNNVKHLKKVIRTLTRKNTFLLKRLTTVYHDPLFRYRNRSE